MHAGIAFSKGIKRNFYFDLEHLWSQSYNRVNSSQSCSQQLKNSKYLPVSGTLGMMLGNIPDHLENYGKFPVGDDTSDKLSP